MLDVGSRRRRQWQREHAVHYEFTTRAGLVTCQRCPTAANGASRSSGQIDLELGVRIGLCSVQKVKQASAELHPSPNTFEDDEFIEVARERSTVCSE